ncbi:MAG: hypothetical protein ACKOC8_07570 [Pirellulales bacterium]
MPAVALVGLTMRRGLHRAAIVVGIATVACSATAGADELDPTGGLRARASSAPEPAPTGASRDELIRRWDLDGNGRIDESEASIARARMRRARVELEQGGGIDPLTGAPRIVADDNAADREEPAKPLPSVTDPPAASGDSQPPSGPPGTRVPTVTGTGTGPRPPATSERASAVQPRTTGNRPTAITGGVRAGAPAARAGYGSLMPGTTLNAGRPAPMPQPRSLPGGGRRGGLVPTLPGRGAVARPAMPTRPAPPTLSPSTTPRITADEIGGF